MSDVLLGPWPSSVSVAVFVVAGVLTVVGAVRMAGLGDTLAARTGWGQALFGAVFFGATSSLSGIVITAVAAASDSPDEAGADELFLTLASALVTVVVVGGLLVRQARGPGRVGFEGVALIGTYLAILAVLSF